MKLKSEEIRAAAWGAIRILEEENGIALRRFTEAEEVLYQSTHTQHAPKLPTTAGIRLAFRTDSPTLRVVAWFRSYTARKYYSLDVLVNGKRIGGLSNFDPEEMIPDYTEKPLPDGEQTAEFALGEGEKTVMLVLPWVTHTVIRELSLADGAAFTPVRREKKLLVYGDSITQGYDALYPTNRYAALLADSLQAEEFNKAIGGEVFFPELARCDSGVEAPDYISVAYGTNDWRSIPEQEFEENCEQFYRILSEKYPMAKIFAITPTWRKDIPDFPDHRPFRLVGDYIRKVTADLPNVTVIDGWELVPQDKAYFADLRLHPNDKGFAEYHKSLYSAMRQYL